MKPAQLIKALPRH